MADTELPKREEVVGDSPTDRMMQMVMSLRAELYDLYAKHQALLDENARLKATQVLTIKLKEENEAMPKEETEVKDKDALRTEATRDDGNVLGSEQTDRTETLTLPTTEENGGKADEGAVSSDADARVKAQTPKFPDFLEPPPHLAPALVTSSSVCCMSPAPNVESECP